MHRQRVIRRIRLLGPGGHGTHQHSSNHKTPHQSSFFSTTESEKQHSYPAQQNWYAEQPLLMRPVSARSGGGSRMKRRSRVESRRRSRVERRRRRVVHRRWSTERRSPLRRAKYRNRSPHLSRLNGAANGRARKRT